MTHDFSGSPNPARTSPRRTVLVVGCSGFIGRTICRELARAGHTVVGGGRDVHSRDIPPWITRRSRGDIAAWSAERWAPALEGVDAVVMAAGAIDGDLEALHAHGPAAFYEACRRAKVERLVAISALGAGMHPGSRFLRTKAMGDMAVQMLGANGRDGWHVVRPSVVIGRGGRSTASMLGLAASPIPIGIGPGTWKLQPIHVDDLARIVTALIDGAAAPTVVEAAGPEILSTDAVTAKLRTWLRLPPRRPIAVPEPLLRLLARFGDRIPGSALKSDSIDLLAAGNVASNISPLVAGIARPIDEALAASPSHRGDLVVARIDPLRPFLIGILAAVWIGSGLASLTVSPDRAAELLAGLGLSGLPAVLVTKAGALLDIALGVAMLRPAWRTRAIAAQLATMAGYTALGTIALPALWLDPFAPMLKNLAVAGVALALLATEE